VIANVRTLTSKTDSTLSQCLFGSPGLTRTTLPSSDFLTQRSLFQPEEFEKG